MHLEQIISIIKIVLQGLLSVAVVLEIGRAHV